MVAATMNVRVRDITGQKAGRLEIDAGSREATVGEFIDDALNDMSLPGTDAHGQPLAYHARLEREGRHLNRAERVGDALRDRDELVLHPNIDAG